MKKNFWPVMKAIAGLLMCRSVPTNGDCINGDNKYLGAVVERNSLNNLKLSIDRSESEIVSMVNILHTRFGRVSLYATDNPNSIDSEIPVAVANANSKSSNQSSVSVVAAMQVSNDCVFEENLDSVVLKMSESNRIHSGTVKGLIVSSSDFEGLHGFQYEDIFKYDSLDPNHFPLVAILNQLVKELPIMINRTRMAKSQTDIKNIKVGIRSGNCEDMEMSIFGAPADTPLMEAVQNYIDGLFSDLNFIVCRKLPLISSEPEASAADLTNTMNKTIAFLSKKWPRLEVVVETGWPSDGKGIAGIDGSVASMETFWCVINSWSKENLINVDLYTAFDEVLISDKENKASVTNYGWWIRIQDDKTGLPIFIEKIKYSPKGDYSTVIIILSVLGCTAVIAAAIVLGYYKVKSAQIEILTKQDLYEFKMGYKRIAGDEHRREEALSHPYDFAYEISQSQFHIDESQLLGKGAFGVVYRGKIHDNDTEAAFKVTQPNCTGTSLKSLLSEIKILIHVGNHPNVVSIIGAYTEDIKRGKVVIAIEFCENGSLEKYLRLEKVSLEDKIRNENGRNEGDNIPSEELNKKLVRLAYEIASGMEHIAWRNVIHADLAARNVLLTGDGSAKITDFGLSRRLYEYTNYVKQNQEPMPWRWMALESLEQLTFSAKSDVWSYGVTLYEIFCLGDIPYPGLSWNQSFTKRLREGLRLERPSWAPDEIFEIMKTCFKINPEERPTFTEIKITLQDIWPELETNEYLSVVS